MNDEDVLVIFDESGELIDSDGDYLIDSDGNYFEFVEGQNVAIFGDDVVVFKDNTP